MVKYLQCFPFRIPRHSYPGSQLTLYFVVVYILVTCNKSECYPYVVYILSTSA
jgi:hypothetical protein